MNLKKAIEEALILRHMNKTKLAEKMGVSTSRVSHILSKKNITVETLKRIANAVDMPVSDLIELGD